MAADTLVSMASGFRQQSGVILARMVSSSANRRLLAEMILVASIVLASPAQAQLGLDLNVGGVGVGLEVGGGSGVDLDVNVGDDVGVGLQVGGDSGGLGLDVDLGGGSLDADLALAPGLSQDGALDAVRDRRALPLEDIILRAKVISDGEVIDAKLVSVNDILLYELKILGTAGDVSKLYFYARSGALVESN